MARSLYNQPIHLPSFNFRHWLRLLNLLIINLPIIFPRSKIISQHARLMCHVYCDSIVLTGNVFKSLHVSWLPLDWLSKRWINSNHFWHDYSLRPAGLRWFWRRNATGAILNMLASYCLFRAVRLSCQKINKVRRDICLPGWHTLCSMGLKWLHWDIFNVHVASVVSCCSNWMHATCCLNVTSQQCKCSDVRTQLKRESLGRYSVAIWVSLKGLSQHQKRPFLLIRTFDALPETKALPQAADGAMICGQPCGRWYGPLSPPTALCWRQSAD